MEESCLKCGPTGCIKCTNKIIYPSRKCADNCPYGYKERWSTKIDYMGRICVDIGNIIGISNDTMTILIGTLSGCILCIFLIGIAYIYVRYKRKILLQQQHVNNMDNVSELDDTPERRDFLKQIETIRPYARTFLDMLNDTRRQMRELYNEGDNTALAAYRPVVRDLAKILLLLNRPIDRMTIPDDWEHLYNWSEKTLKRYKRMSEVSQPQVAQLINFLQGPILSNEIIINDTEDECESINNRSNTIMSTFKPDKPFGSSLSLQDSAIKNFNMNYESAFPTAINPQWKFDFTVGGSGTLSTSEFNPIVWKSSKEFLNNTYFLDDDFCQLGFRPQDEITTEL